ncbi:MAG: DUF4198 domain-containing protein [Candidatus Acidiferrales bacterium]
MRRRFPTLAVLLLAACSLAAHDTWLVPQKFRVPAGQPVQVALNTSEDFPTSEAGAAADRIASFEVVTADGRAVVTGYRVEGKSLVADVTPGSGTTLVAAATKHRFILLKPEQFTEYITAERLEAIVAARKARGAEAKDGREYYSKIAKLALCSAGREGAEPWEPMGLTVEIVPLVDPCGLQQGDELEVEVLFNGRPLAGTWVGAGYAGVHGHGYPVWVKTDAEGQAKIPLDRKGAWFVRVLHMIPSKDFPDADWQSWFSTLTFEAQ